MKYGIVDNKNSLLPSVLRAKRKKKWSEIPFISSLALALAFALSIAPHKAFMFRKSEETIKME